MDILFLTTSPLEYNSSANMRNIALMKGLHELGHNITTLTAQPSIQSEHFDDYLIHFSFSERYFFESDNKLNSDNYESNNIKTRLKEKIKMPLYKVYTALSIYDPRKRYIFSIDKFNINKQYDVLISSSDPKSSHLIAERLINKNPKIAKKWIQYWGDPFADDINKKSIIPKSFILKEEARILSFADKIVYVSPFTLKKQMENIPAASNKMSFLPVPYIEPITFEEKGENKIFTVGYFGDYKSSDRNIIPLYDAIRENGAFFHVYGNGDIKLEEGMNISINSRKGFDIIKKVEQDCDLLICICNKNGTQIPGKIYHYAATNKPILIILDGENSGVMREYFESFNRYEICENTKEDIKKSMTLIMNEKKKYIPSPYFNPVSIAKMMLE